MPPQHVNGKLLRELEESNAYFDDLVDIFPAKLYVAGNTGDEVYNPKYFKGQHKESKESRRARNKAAKRAKFDPEQAETTLQAKLRKDTEEDSEDGSEDEVVEEQESEEELSSTPPPSASRDDETSKSTSTVDIPDNASRIEALRAKLHAKIAEKRALRPQPTDASAVSKRAARRAEKQRRQEEAKKKKAAATAVRGQNSKLKLAKTGTALSSGTSTQQDLEHMDFGKLAGLNASNTLATPYSKGANKSLTNMNKKKSLEKMLADAESKRQKLLDLKKGSAEDKAKYEKMQWSDALKEADGERIKDDPAKLKKALKKKAAKKAKSQKAWKSRLETTQDKMSERQKIRNHNLDKRKLGGAVGANLSKKKIVDDSAESKTSRRLSRAGFEGKKQDFINGKAKTTVQ
mmetsp:Transcript_22869/g.25778  ORF Transcript_22869/g.25778 Transcript_22869/m.25778 type:complete len:404 (+) Transcript_22869:123-1334(+)|eukprot:CAMPEP_0195285264 /NCGR_PEP_ID=MMETSP0707-20130614/3165_1 /TAXON_ID=33640 /ORGANISM="Asterionellopsis glacialis, Strain CCMP134" /LENGTH=403 /DNA_ID=CAMNT_0040344735 /DNA_START=120 /DNA_END=1331 /DNA_ORIENTATION=-